MSPAEIFHRMFDNDPFSHWMGLELMGVDGGTCTLRMTVREEMLNGFGVAHGAITFALADSAFAFACNSRGRHALSIHCTVEHLTAVRAGDELIAAASELHLGHTLSRYEVTVQRTDGVLVALFRGVAYRKSEAWL